MSTPNHISSYEVLDYTTSLLISGSDWFTQICDVSYSEQSEQRDNDDLDAQQEEIQTNHDYFFGDHQPTLIEFPSEQSFDEEARSNNSPITGDIDQHQAQHEVFKEGSLSIQKNNNVPKHFLKRKIDRYSSLGKQFFQQDPKILREFNRFVIYERKMYRQHKNWNNNLEAMKKFFGIIKDSSNPLVRSFLTRKFAHTLITKQILPELKANPQIELLKSYMFTYKVLALRCVNSELMKRTQIR